MLIEAHGRIFAVNIADLSYHTAKGLVHEVNKRLKEGQHLIDIVKADIYLGDRARESPILIFMVCDPDPRIKPSFRYWWNNISETVGEWGPRSVIPGSAREIAVAAVRKFCDSVTSS